VNLKKQKNVTDKIKSVRKLEKIIKIKVINV